MPLITLKDPAAFEPNLGPGEGNPPPALSFSPDLREFRAPKNIAETIQMARELIQDNTFSAVRAWVSGGGHAVAFFPVYTPHELAASLGMLPVTVRGGGEELEITHADAAL
ncbi:MAG: hypothetical protein L3K09_07035, partial [Thermoplasmata archaeon]|nr:hypothetical protein [Thermoplasmata archaeon]